MGDERSREFTDALHQLWGIVEPFDFANDCAAGDGSIRKTPHLPPLLCACSSKPLPFCLSESSSSCTTEKRRDKVVESEKKWGKVIKSATFHYGNPRDRRRDLMGQIRP